MKKGPVWKIALVDDQAVDRFIIDRCLAIAGVSCEVIEFDNSTNAIQYFKSVDKSKPLPDLVITDMDMDKADGFAVINAVRSNRRTADIPIVAMTSYPAAFLKEKTISLGADLFFVKPPSIEVMNKILIILCERKRTRDP